jgi:adenine-specific DNA-methyltransferase
LLAESGSCFVQISDENVHHVRELMDEVFGARNFVNLISFATSTGSSTNALPRTTDYIIWYAKNRSILKFHQLYGEQDEYFSPAGSDERGEYELASMTSQDLSETRSGTLIFQGQLFSPSAGRHWSFNPANFQRLVTADRVVKVSDKQIRWKKYKDERVRGRLANRWNDTQFAGFSSDKVFVVQTAQKVIERCLLMTTDPGDLVFDPTCGSGTTAYVAEQWGRRWITCDTSRVAIAIARQRLMTAVFDYYELAHPQEGVGSGFKYKTVPHVTLKSIANNPEIDGIYARLHPAVEAALAELNAALKLSSRDGRGAGGEGYPRFKVTTGGRSGHFVDFAAPDTATFTMPAGQVVRVNELVEWEVPFEFPADWPEKARDPFERFHQARRALQREIDAAIARHAPQETLYDQPFVDKKKVRVTGPFTVEAVPAPVVKSVDEILEAKPQPADMSIARSGETLRQAEWRDELLRTGIRGKNGQYIRFARLEPLPGCRWLHAEGETRPSDEGADTVRETGPAYDPMRVVVSFGPEYGPLEQRQVEYAWQEAHRLVPRPKLLIFAAFQFDPEAAKDIDEMKPELAGMQFLKVQMNADLLTDDLKKKRASNESFWLIGQPDVEVQRITSGPDEGKLRVVVHGFDYYNTKTGNVESGGADKIAVWLLDTDYDGRSLYPRQVFFPMAGEDGGWAKLAKNLKAEIDEELIEAYRGTVSLPFAPGEHKRIAVKIVDDRGIESLKVIEV